MKSNQMWSFLQSNHAPPREILFLLDSIREPTGAVQSHLLRGSHLPLRRVIFQQLLDQIHVRHDHSSTAVALAADFVEGFAVGHLLREEVDVGFPEVGYDL